MTMSDGGPMSDGGLGVVRVKPLGAGGGGAERSAGSAAAGVEFSSQGVRVDGLLFSYPSHVIGPEILQDGLYDAFMPPRIEGFLGGVNVNIMAYGQTCSGKTHTVFGPPGIMAAAASGCFGTSVVPEYGLFPRALIGAFQEVQRRRAAGARLVLTASAVELSWNQGNLDMFAKGGVCVKHGWQKSSGVNLDKTTVPPRLYGQVEFPLEEEGDLLKVFAALASRNVAATGMNDASSRSHCFAFLTLYAADGDAVQRSRFQFVDLAGSERLKDAHFGLTDAMKAGGEVMNGLLTNYSLMMLSSCVRALVEARKKGKTISFRAYLFDLVLLLQESLTGDAMTACFVCVSQAPDNATQTKFVLDFGEVFAQLSPSRGRAVLPAPLAALAANTRKTIETSKAALAKGSAGKYALMREGQIMDGQQLLGILEKLK